MFDRDNAKLGQFQPGAFSYEQTLQQLLQNRPQYSMSPEQMRERAQEAASLQIDPQIHSLQRWKDDQRGRDLESAISRNAGRSGQVEWLANQRQNRFGDNMQNLEAQRGAITSQALAGLESQQHARGVDDWNMQQNAAQMLANMAHQNKSFEWSKALDTHDRTMLTPLQQLQLHLGYTDALGETPPWMFDEYGQRQNDPGGGIRAASSGGGHTATHAPAAAHHSPAFVSPVTYYNPAPARVTTPAPAAKPPVTPTTNPFAPQNTREAQIRNANRNTLDAFRRAGGF